MEFFQTSLFSYTSPIPLLSSACITWGYLFPTPAMQSVFIVFFLASLLCFMVHMPLILLLSIPIFLVILGYLVINFIPFVRDMLKVCKIYANILKLSSK